MVQVLGQGRYADAIGNWAVRLAPREETRLVIAWPRKGELAMSQLLALMVIGLALGAVGVHAADEKKLPRCFLDITADGKPVGRIVVELPR